MKALILFFSIYIFSTFAHETKQSYDIELFCQDINVLLQKLDVSSNNLANINTTRVASGGPYQKKIIKSCKKGHCETHPHKKSTILRYEPKPPAANTEGYVAYPNISEAEEKYNILKIQNIYETVWANRPPEITGKDWIIGDKFKNCFKKYNRFRELYDFQSQLGR